MASVSKTTMLVAALMLLTMVQGLNPKPVKFKPGCFEGLWETRPYPTVISINAVSGTGGKVVQIMGQGWSAPGIDVNKTLGETFGWISTGVLSKDCKVWHLYSTLTSPPGKNFTGVLTMSDGKYAPKSQYEFIQFPWGKSSGQPAFANQWYKISP